MNSKSDNYVSQETVNSIRRSSRQLVREWGVLRTQSPTFSEGHTLIELKEHGPLTVSALASALVLGNAATSRLISRLLAKNWVTLMPNINCQHTDRRLKYYGISKKGKIILQKINTAATKQVKRALELLTEDEQKKIDDGLKAYACALQQVKK
jgi:DNA-binding MarR family transcriptional regulator